MVPNPGRRGGRRRWGAGQVGGWRGEGRGGGGGGEGAVPVPVPGCGAVLFCAGEGRGNWRSVPVPVWGSTTGPGTGHVLGSVPVLVPGWGWSWNWKGSVVSSGSGSGVGFVMIHSVIRILPRRSLQTKHVGVEKTSKLLPRLASRGQQTERKSPTRTRSDMTSRATCL